MNTENKTRASDVQQMFSHLAPHYDRMNRIMSASQDASWRRLAITLAQLPPKGYLLDLGSGTGKLAKEAQLQYPDAQIVAADFTFEMMKTGCQDNRSKFSWCAADALKIPFPDQSFDAVVSGFLLRNVKELDSCLKEQFRVLKYGGKLVTLDTTRPTPHFFSPLVHFYLTQVIPRLGQVLTGNLSAYQYLPASTLKFLTAETLAEAICSVGFQQVGFRRLMVGSVAIHWGLKTKLTT